LKSALCEWPTERQKPRGTTLSTATWRLRRLAIAYCMP
jgi:hypothetical protein